MRGPVYTKRQSQYCDNLWPSDSFILKTITGRNSIPAAREGAHDTWSQYWFMLRLWYGSVRILLAMFSSFWHAHRIVSVIALDLTLGVDPYRKKIQLNSLAKFHTASSWLEIIRSFHVTNPWERILNASSSRTATVTNDVTLITRSMWRKCPTGTSNCRASSWFLLQTSRVQSQSCVPEWSHGDECTGDDDSDDGSEMK